MSPASSQTYKDDANSSASVTAKVSPELVKLETGSVSSPSFAERGAPLWHSKFLKRMNYFTSIQSKEGDVKGTYLKSAIVVNALELLSNIMTNHHLSPAIGLNRDGTLVFEWERDDVFFSVNVDSDKSYEFYFENKDKEIEDEVSSFSPIVEILENFKQDEE